MSYSTSYFTTRESWRDWRIEARESIRLAQVNRGVRVLEIGCGGGGLLRMLCERGAFAVGVDTLETALKLANASLRAHSLRSVSTSRTSPSHKEIASSHPATRFARSGSLSGMTLVKVGEDGTLPFCNVAFDAIIGQHVIEHLDEPRAALREWHRLLKPNGRIALVTPNAHYPDSAHFADADHAHIFTPRELRDAVERSGFAIESCYTIFPFLTRARLLRAVGIISYNVFRYAPYFSARGRTIMLAARKK